MSMQLLLLIMSISVSTLIYTDGNNYTDLIKDYPVTIILFCTSTHCDSLASEWNFTHNDQSEQIAFTYVNCSASKCVSVLAYPTIRVFSHGKMLISNYDGEKTYSNWVKLATKIIDPFTLPANPLAPKLYLITNDFEQFGKLSYKFIDAEFVDIKKIDHILLGKANTETGMLLAKAENFYSYSNIQYCIPLQADYKCPASYIQLQIPLTSEGIMIVKPEEKRIVYLNSTMYSDTNLLLRFIIPFIGQFTKEVADTIFIYEKKGIILYTSNSTQSKNYETALKKAAMLHTIDVFIFAIADPESDLGKRMFDYLGLLKKDLPLLLGISFDKHTRKSTLHQFNGEASVANIDKFINEWNNGTLKRKYKSEDIPDVQDNKILKVVSKNFDDMVLNKQNDVIVKFFSPGCGACIKFKPTYEKLAEEYKSLNKENIEFMEINVLLNEVEGIEIKYYPTIKYFAAGKKDKPTTFSGREKTYEKMIEFFKESASNTIVHPHTAKIDL